MIDAVLAQARAIADQQSPADAGCARRAAGESGPEKDRPRLACPDFGGRGQCRLTLSCANAARAIGTQPLSQRWAITVGVSVV